MMNQMYNTIVPQLNTGNFNNWKFRVKALLEEKQLENTLEKLVSDCETEKDQAEFKIKDAKAKSIIVQCVSDKHLDIIKDSNTAKEMVKALEDVFQRKSIFTKLTLKKKLLTLKHKKNQKLEDHFHIFDTLIRELESIESKVQESDKVCHLLLSLNEEYEAVITAIETLNTDVTMDFVKSRLLDEELKIKNKQGINETAPEVSFKTNMYTCYKCGKEGHKIADCRQNNYSRYRRGNSRNRGRNRRGNFQDRSQDSSQANKADEIAFIALSSSTSTRRIDNFIMDSGCTQHMVMGELEGCMSNVTNLETQVKIGTAKADEVLIAAKQGTLIGTCQGKDITIEALIVPGMSHNLISVSKLLRKDFKVTFNNDRLGKKRCVISKNNSTIYCNFIDNLFSLNIDLKSKNCNYIGNENCNVAEKNTDNNIWHRRLGHINRYSLKLLGLPYSKEICKSCIEGKSTRKPFYKSKSKSVKIGQLIHTDIAGPISQPTPEGYKFFQVMIDDYSHFLIVKLLKSKNEAEQNIIDFIKLIKTQHNQKTQRIRCDNGGEFSSNYFKSFCKNTGIQLEYTMPYTPQENGIAERMNRSLLDKVRTKFAETNLPRELWGEAIQCAAYELNRSPTEANNGETPASRWHKNNDLSKLRIFGSETWAVVLPKQSKLEKRAKHCIMVGYSGGGYRLWDYKKDEIFCSRDVRFNEKQTDYEQIRKSDTSYVIIQNEKDKEKENIDNNGEVIQDLQDANENSNNTQENDEEISTSHTQNTRSGRKVNAPKYLNEYEVYTAYCLLASQADPETYEEAINDGEWKEAIIKELKSHEKLQTWKEESLPEGKTAIQTKWVFRTKDDGTKKARIVAKGFQLKEGSYFDPVYAPVARISTIRLLMSIALQNDWNIRQLDIPTAFLNGKLENDVYIYTPDGLETKSQILKLNRALYGLKESPKVWNDTFNEFALENNFERSKYDCCLYCSENVWILIYVDDILVMGKEENVKETVKLLQKYFQAKDMGNVKNFLGMTITRNEDKIKITQTKFIEKLLKIFNMETCNNKATPMETCFEYNPDSVIIDVPYRQLIGGLMYLSTTTRLDITFSVSYLSRFLDKPTTETWNAAKRILRYLQGTKEMGLTYIKNKTTDVVLQGYSDADWARDKNDRKSVSGGIILHGENPVSWFSKKQGCVALSTAEAEYVAAATCAQDLINLRGILNEFKLCETVLLYCDNKSSILMAKSNQNSKRAKHIDIKNHYLKDLVSKKLLAINYVSSDQNLADIMTKPLCKDKLVYIRDKTLCKC